jgi:hypothetical protein
MRSIRFCLILSLLFCACSRMKMAYELGPWYLEKEAREALPSLTAEQSRRLKQDVQAYAHWHRQQALPAYAEALHSLAAGLSGSAAARSSRLAGPLLTGLWAQSVEPLIKPSAALLCSMDHAQLQAFREKLAQRSRRQRQLYLDNPEKAFQRRFKTLRSYMEDYAGGLSAPQVQRFETLSRSFVIPYRAWIEHKERQQQELLRLLEEHHGVEAVQGFLRDWWLGPRSGGEGREAWQWDEKAQDDYVKGTLDLLDPLQRQRVAVRLENLARDFETLHANPEPAPRPTAPLP